MNEVVLKCIKNLRASDGRVWIEGETYRLYSHEVRALEDELSKEVFDIHFRVGG